MTTKQYNELKNDSQEFIAKAKAVLSKFQEHNLTPTFSKSELESEYKTHLFSELLKVDKGLRFRYELHRTEESKMKLINDTISLEGYDIVDELLALLEDYRLAHPSCLVHSITPERFLIDFKGDFQAAFGSYVRDVTNEPLYQKFKTIEVLINELIPEIKCLSQHSITMSDVLKKGFVHRSPHDSFELEVSESYMIFLIDYEKEQRERLEQRLKDEAEIEAWNKSEKERIEKQHAAWLAKQSGR